MKFLQELPITSEEQEKLNKLDVNTPGELYGLISTSLDQFESYFGHNRTWHLVRHLYPLLTAQEKAAFTLINALEIKKKAIF